MKCGMRAMALLMVLMIIGGSYTALAMDTGLTTEALSNEELAHVKEQWLFVESTAPAQPLAVHYFDVRDDHMLLLGTKAGINELVTVYDAQGVFQYGLRVPNHSGDFRIAWSGEHILFYSIRGGMAFEIDDTGAVLDVRRVLSVAENSAYDRKVLSARQRQVGTCTYTMTNGHPLVDALSASYGNIVRADEDGVVVLYDASSSRTVRMIVGMAAFVLFSAFIAFGIVRGVREHVAKMTNGNAVG